MLTLPGFLPQDVNGELEDLVHHAIRPWMKRCLKEHTTTCNHEAKSSNNPILPTRLLFVGNQTHPTPKLVENQNRTYTRYLILSYSWGSSGNHNKVKTLEENYQARLEGIDISELPKTIQDAIEVTRAMGESYIWIDAICIKQDKDPNVSDWDLESPKVGDYYANALCMISAMRAKDSAEGFLTERKLSKYPHRQSLLACGKTPHGDKNVHIWAEVINPQLGLEADTEPLMDRGWCLQERALCPRRLHWTKNGLFWECNKTSSSEHQALSGVSSAIWWMGTLATHHVFSVEDKSRALAEQWCFLIQRYSGMALSYPTDRLVAIHGIAARLIKQRRDQYCAGVFESQVRAGLLWYSTEHARKDSNFPSWSWASVTDRVTWLQPWTGPNITTKVQVTSFPSSIPVTKVAAGETCALGLTAPIAEVTLDGGKEREDVWVSSKSKDWPSATARVYPDPDSGLRLDGNIPRTVKVAVLVQTNLDNRDDISWGGDHFKREGRSK